MKKINTGLSAGTNKSPYNPKFIAKIKKSAKDRDGKQVTAETLWQDLGVLFNQD